MAAVSSTSNNLPVPNDNNVPPFGWKLISGITLIGWLVLPVNSGV